MITDTLPDGLFLSDVRIPTGWTLELKCDTSWITIPQLPQYGYLSNWLAFNTIAGTLDNLLIDPMQPNTPANQTGCAADTLGVSQLNGIGLKTEFNCIRMTTAVGSNPDDFIFMTTALDESVTPGTILNNCACLLYTSPSPRDATLSRMPSSA